MPKTQQTIWNMFFITNKHTETESLKMNACCPHPPINLFFVMWPQSKLMTLFTKYDVVNMGGEMDTDFMSEKKKIQEKQHNLTNAYILLINYTFD